MFSFHSGSKHSGPKGAAPGTAAPKRRPSALAQQAVLNVGLVCLAAGAVFGKQVLLHFSLFSAVAGCASPAVKNLGLTDLYLLGTGTGQETARVEWDGDSTATQFVNGGTPSPSVLTNNNGHYVFVDTFAPQAGTGTKRVYTVQQLDPPPPPPPYPYTACTVTISPPVTINVTPVLVAVSGNQSVDARYDPRYALWTHLNHNFGSTINGSYVTGVYRGGLYAGYNGDNSQVGHGYMNFALPSVPQGQSLWPNVGSVNAYYLRSYTPGSTSVGCRSTSAAWNGAALTWSTAPGALANGAVPAATVSYDNQTPVPQPIAGWTHWGMAGEIPSAVPGGSYGAFLYGTSEPSTATDPIGGAATRWAYFSKKEYAPGQPACILYAYSN